MAEDAKKQDQLIETTDCLEAVGTLKFNKNLFFFIILFCLLILQAIFWIVPSKYIEMPGGEQQVQQTSLAAAQMPLLASKANKENEKPGLSEKKPAASDSQAAQAADEKAEESAPQQLAADVNTEPNDPNASAAKSIITIPPIKLKFSQLLWIIKPVNFLLIVVSVMYSLSLLFAMKVSLVGKLGGIRHITKAVFTSFWIVVIILPWQLLFKDVIYGAIYTPAELLNAWQNFDHANLMANTTMFIRFTGLWLLVVIFLFWAQLKSMRWSKNTLKRLGIVA